MLFLVFLLNEQFEVAVLEDRIITFCREYGSSLNVMEIRNECVPTCNPHLHTHPLSLPPLRPLNLALLWEGLDYNDLHAPILPLPILT